MGKTTELYVKTVTISLSALAALIAVFSLFYFMANPGLESLSTMIFAAVLIGVSVILGQLVNHHT